MKISKYFFHLAATTIENVSMMLIHNCDEYGLLEFKQFFNTSCVYKRKMNEDFLCEHITLLDINFILLHQSKFHSKNSSLYKSLKTFIHISILDLFFTNLFTR